MPKRNPCKGSAAIPVTLALCLLILVIATVYYSVARPYWLPIAITDLGREVDAQFYRTLYVTGIVFIASQLALGWLIIRYRDRGGRAVYSHGNNKMEFLWTLATAVLFIGTGIYGVKSWGAVHFQPADPGALQVEVTAQQFAWNIRYPGPDGQFGRTDPKLMNDAGGNPVGLDFDDPAAKDDLVLPIMAVPVNRQVEVILRTKDVTHSWSVRELRLKQDTVPGLELRIHFTATQTGEFEIACAELCGMLHHRMRSVLMVKTQADFEQWLRDQAVTE